MLDLAHEPRENSRLYVPPTSPRQPHQPRSHARASLTPRLNQPVPRPMLCRSGCQLVLREELDGMQVSIPDGTHNLFDGEMLG